jgi:hypothetical protein
MKDNRLTRLLVTAFGLYQLGHILSNIRGAFIFFDTGQIDFPALPPPGGWSVDMMNVFIDMASMDSLNAVASLIFVWAYFKKKPWRLWLGTLTLTLSVYAAILFNLSAYQAGAWVGGNLWSYILINITYLPVLILCGMVYYWGAKSFVNHQRDEI